MSPKKREYKPIDIPKFAEIAPETPPDRKPLHVESPWLDVVRAVLAREGTAWFRIKEYKETGDAYRASTSMRNAAKKLAVPNFEVVVRGSTVYARRTVEP